MKTLLTSRRTLAILGVILVILGLDQLTKSMARSALMASPPLNYWGGSITLQYSLNPGAFLSLGAGMNEGLRFWVFTVVVSLFLLGITVYLIRKQDMDHPSTAALALIIGGGIGNLIDRISVGSVTDFIHMGVGPLRTGIFNVADMAITGGTIILILLSFKPKTQKK